MRGRDDRSEGFFSYVRLEERIPEDHPLRPIRALADEALAALNNRFEGLYSTMGRPSIAPLGVILDHPNGMGPFEFSRVFGMQQHDVYMQGFLVYGWLGGAAYLTLVAVTLAVGPATVGVPTPWQNYLIVRLSWVRRSRV